MMVKYFTYILYSESKDRMYVGQTADMQTRLAKHNHGEVRSSKGGIPWVLAYQEGFSSRSEAMAEERKFKNLKSRRRMLERMFVRKSRAESIYIDSGILEKWVKSEI